MAFIKDLTKEDLKLKCADIIIKSINDAGYFNYGKEKAKILTDGLIDLCNNYYQNIPIEYVSAAIDKGVMHDYGDYMGLGKATFNVWVKKYLNNLNVIAKKKKQQLDKDATSSNTMAINLSSSFSDMSEEEQKKYPSLMYYLGKSKVKPSKNKEN